MTPPAALVAALAVLYPGITLNFSIARQRFWLGQQTPHGTKVLRILTDQFGQFVPAHDANTIGWLCESDHLDMDTEWKKREFLQGLDDHKQRYDDAKQAIVSDYIRHELAKPLLKVMRSGKLPQVNGRARRTYQPGG